MSDSPLKPALQKPPGYKDPNAPAQFFPQLPARKPALPPSFHPKKKRKSCWGACCCFLCVLILLIIFVVSLASGLFYLWFEPQLPIFRLQSFRMPQFNVTVKSDGTYLDAQTITRVEVKNPNGNLILNYGDTDVELTVGDDTGLGSETIAGFTQGRKNTTSLKIETRLRNQLVDDGEGMKLKEWAQNKELEVKVEAETKAGVVVEGWRIGPVGIKVLCGSTLKSLEAGDMPRCIITLLNWINLHG